MKRAILLRCEDCSGNADDCGCDRGIATTSGHVDELGRDELVDLVDLCVERACLLATRSRIGKTETGRLYRVASYLSHDPDAQTHTEAFELLRDAARAMRKVQGRRFYATSWGREASQHLYTAALAVCELARRTGVFATATHEAAA